MAFLTHYTQIIALKSLALRDHPDLTVHSEISLALSTLTAYPKNVVCSPMIGPISDVVRPVRCYTLECLVNNQGSTFFKTKIRIIKY